MKILRNTGYRSGKIAFVLSLLAISVVAKSSRSTVVWPGIWCSQTEVYMPSMRQREKLQTSLRRITGWTQLAFIEEGKLEIGDASAIEGGSFWARQMLMKSLRCGKQFVLENHSASASVNFGQLDEGTNYGDERTGLMLEIHRVRLDFVDFDKMSAPPAVMESFDVGFIFLHELLHGLGLKDTKIPNEIGDCETVVNEMRAELGLPLRDQYLADLLRLTPFIKTIRLRFKSQTINRQGIARWKTHHLYFMAESEMEPPAAKAARNAFCRSLY